LINVRHIKDAEAAFATGMDDFISKPFDVDAAVTIVRRLAGLPASTATPVALHNTPPKRTVTLPGLNISKGLKVWRDADRYRQYLRKFSRDYQHCVQKIRETDPHEGARIAHKLKGAAGNLALDDIARLAHEVECMLGQQGNADNGLQGLQQAVETALVSINQYAPAPHHVAPAEQSATQSESLSSLLLKVFHAFDSDNPDNIEPLIPALRQRLTPEQVAPLLKSLEDFDFVEGKAAVVSLAKDLDVALE